MITEKKKIAILGTGKIAVDLLYKARDSKSLQCALFAGRRKGSEGLKIAKSIGVETSNAGISAVMTQADDLDILFDATSARSHAEHWGLLRETGIKVIDMTPSGIGDAIVPSVNIAKANLSRNVNMISCGGQASIPIVAAVARAVKGIRYVEVVSSIASNSAGPATRLNLDEYIAGTEKGISQLSGIKNTKVIIVLNPAEPPVTMQTTISFEISDPPMDRIAAAVLKKSDEVKAYVPGYDIIVNPRLVQRDRVTVMIKVTGRGDYLPKYAGNLDIINCAAIAVAEAEGACNGTSA